MASLQLQLSWSRRGSLTEQRERDESNPETV